MSKLVLGSGSPRRMRLLTEAGVDFEIVKTDAPEVFDESDPAGTVMRNALAKNAACRVLRPGRSILTADTLVWFDGKLLGKPISREEAVGMLESYSGRTQTVFTGVAYYDADAGSTTVRAEASTVLFRELSHATVEEYIDLVRPFDRAGAYDVATCRDLLIESVTGSESNVVGLPMEMVLPMLGR